MSKERQKRQGQQDTKLRVQSDLAGVLAGTQLRELLRDNGPTPQERRFPGAQYALQALQKVGYHKDSLRTHELTFARRTQQSLVHPLELTERFSQVSAYFITAQHETTGEYLILCVVAGEIKADRDDYNRLLESEDLTSMYTALQIPASAAVTLRMFDCSTSQFDQPFEPHAHQTQVETPEEEPLSIAVPEHTERKLSVDFSLTEPAEYTEYLEKLGRTFAARTDQKLDFGPYQTTVLFDGAVRLTTLPVTLKSNGLTATITLALVSPPYEKIRNFFGVVNHIYTRITNEYPKITREMIAHEFKRSGIAVLVAQPHHRVGAGQVGVLNAAFSQQRFMLAETVEDPESLFNQAGLREIAEQVTQLPEVEQITDQGMIQEGGDWYYNFELRLVSGSSFHVFLLAPHPKLRTLKELHKKHILAEVHQYSLSEFTALIQANHYCILMNNGVRLEEKQHDILHTAIRRTELEMLLESSEVTDNIPPAVQRLLEGNSFTIGWPGVASPVGVFTFSSEPEPLHYVRVMRKGRLFRVVYVPEQELRGHSNLQWLQARVLTDMATVEAFAKNNILVILSDTVEPARDAGGQRHIILSHESQESFAALIDEQQAR